MLDLLKKTLVKSFDDEIFKDAGALAYSTLFSMAPILIIAIGLAGLVFGQETTEGRVFHEIKNLVGAEGAATIQRILRNASSGGKDIWAMIIGGLLFLMGATTIFTQLKSSLNKIWRIQSDPSAGNVIPFFKNRLLSLAIIIGCGILLILSLSISALLTYFRKWILLFINMPSEFLEFTHEIFSIGIIAVFFALIFKVLPDIILYWRDVLIGAFATSVLFSIGKFLIAFYIANTDLVPLYGAAGSLVIILLWVYYSALIILMGSVFTQVWTTRKKRRR